MDAYDKMVAAEDAEAERESHIGLLDVEADKWGESPEQRQAVLRQIASDE